MVSFWLDKWSDQEEEILIYRREESSFVIDNECIVDMIQKYVTNICDVRNNLIQKHYVSVKNNFLKMIKMVAT